MKFESKEALSADLRDHGDLKRLTISESPGLTSLPSLPSSLTELDICEVRTLAGMHFSTIETIRLQFIKIRALVKENSSRVQVKLSSHLLQLCAIIAPISTACERPLTAREGVVLQVDN